MTGSEFVKTVLALAMAFALGGATGAIVLVRWWARALEKPAFRQKLLRDLYREMSKPHEPGCPHQPEPGCCPVCGFNPNKAKEEFDSWKSNSVFEDDGS